MVGDMQSRILEKHRTAARQQPLPKPDHNTSPIKH
jgi:hypothetical protein